MTLSQFGFSAVEAIVAISISGVVIMGSSKLISDTATTGSRSERLFWLEARRTQIQNMIRSDDGWLAIQSRNSGMSCLTSGTGCAAFRAPQPLQFPIDNLVLNGANNNVGMTGQGDFCFTFDATNGDRRCPIGLNLRWQVDCDDTACLHGQPKITVNFQVKDPSGSVTENMSSYNIVVFKDPKLETLNEVCVSMGGTLSGMTCTLPQMARACDPASGSFVLGFDSTGGVICGRPNPGNCSSSDGAAGFDATGGIRCASGCP